jgi:hypothetical protein
MMQSFDASTQIRLVREIGPVYRSVTSVDYHLHQLSMLTGDVASPLECFNVVPEVSTIFDVVSHHMLQKRSNAHSRQCSHSTSYCLVDLREQRFLYII